MQNGHYTGAWVEAKNGLKIGQNRPKTCFFPGYSQNTPKYAKKALVLPLGHICAGKKASCAQPLAIFGDKMWLYTAFRGVIDPAGLALQDSSCFHHHRPRSTRINLVNYQFYPSQHLSSSHKTGIDKTAIFAVHSSFEKVVSICEFCGRGRDLEASTLELGTPPQIRRPS